MDSLERQERLAGTMEAIQRRWGQRALRTAGDVAAHVPVCPTGLPALDAATGIGGLPQGRLTELVGCGTAGHLSVAASALAQAQRMGLQVAYVDAFAAVDLEALARRNAQLDALVILRPRGLVHALAMISDLLRARGVGMVILDRLDLNLLAEHETAQALDRALRDWAPLLSRAEITLLVVTETPSPGRYPAGTAVPFYASLRLSLEHAGWLRRGARVTGYTVNATVVKNKLAPPGQCVALTFCLSG
ncbi:MAG: hypothetical protein GX557_14870 [Chloroflexi bacterium]|nr:hypothetical protein [Chloroflexota bacterium]